MGRAHTLDGKGQQLQRQLPRYEAKVVFVSFKPWYGAVTRAHVAACVTPWVSYAGLRSDSLPSRSMTMGQPSAVFAEMKIEGFNC
jgi:hypothetical protein